MCKFYSVYDTVWTGLGLSIVWLVSARLLADTGRKARTSSTLARIALVTRTRPSSYNAYEPTRAHIVFDCMCDVVKI